MHRKYDHLTCKLALLVSLHLICGASRADRLPYGTEVTLEARTDTYRVVHHHDWSQAPESLKFNGLRPFGVDAATSWMEWRSLEGNGLITRTSSPPLTWLGATADSQYVVGLSTIKYRNLVQMVVFDREGRLVEKRNISPDMFCLKPASYESFRKRYAAEFSSLEDKGAYVSPAVWEDSRYVYVEVWAASSRLRDALWSTLCPSPYSPNFSESVTNHVYWYDKEEPAPQIVEHDGLPMAIRLRDPKGVQMEILLEAGRERQRGLREARADVASGRLTTKGFGLPMPRPAYDRLLRKYRLTSESMGCVVTDSGLAYLRAYREIMDQEIERRYGKGFWQRFDAELERAERR